MYNITNNYFIFLFSERWANIWRKILDILKMNMGMLEPEKYLKRSAQNYCVQSLGAMPIILG